MNSFLAYALLQVPDIAAAALVLALAVGWDWLSWRWAAGLFAAWVVKDFALYPALRKTFRLSRLGREALIGARAVVEVALAPRGQVRVAGELWRAQAVGSAESIPPGTRVIVRDLRGLTLFVEAEADAEGPSGG